MKIYFPILGTSILRNIKEVKGVAFLRDVPAMELPLKAVHENNPPQSFEVKLY